MDIPRSSSGIPKELEPEATKGSDFARRIKWVGRNQLVIATNKGFVHSCFMNGIEQIGEWQYLYYNDKATGGGHFESLITSPANDILLLGDTNGNSMLVSASNHFQPYRWHAHDAKVTSLFWPASMCKQKDNGTIGPVYTSGVIDGKLKQWHVLLDPDTRSLCVVLHATFSLASVSQAGSSILSLGIYQVATNEEKGQPKTDFLICGDSMGSVHLFLLSSSEQTDCKTERAPVVTIKNVHKGEKVTHVLVRSPHEIYTVSNGRHGSLQRYVLDTQIPKLTLLRGGKRLAHLLEGIERILLPTAGTGAATGTVYSAGIDSPPLPSSSSALARGKKFFEKDSPQKYSLDEEADYDDEMMSDIPEDVFLFGFHSQDIVIVNLRNKTQSLRIHCGRSKRGCDFAYDHSPDGKFSLAFTTNRKITVHSSSPLMRPYHNMIIAQRDPFHGVEVNDLVFLENSTSSGNSSSHFYFVTGSNDTTAKVWCMRFKCSWQLQCLHTIHGHTSVVRTLAVINCGDDQSLLFSGGGDCVLQCTLISGSQFERCQYIAQYRPSITQCRVMAVIALRTAAYYPANTTRHALVVADSFGQIQVLGFDATAHTFTLLMELEGFTSTVLSLDSVAAVFDNKDNSDIRWIVFAGGTTGCVHLWDVTSAVRTYISSHYTPAIPTTTTTTTTLPQATMPPLYTFEGVHQSGVNCMTVITQPWRSGTSHQTTASVTAHIPHAAAATTFMLATGGDDQAIQLVQFRLSLHQSLEVRVAPLHRWHEPLAHGSNVSAIRTDGLTLVSSGPDQRINMWQVPNDHSKNNNDNSDNNENAKKLPPPLMLKRVASHLTAVADVSSMLSVVVPDNSSCFPTTFHTPAPAKQAHADSLRVIVAGVGLQCLHLIRNGAFQ
eukprot:TRINITY_DN1074_c2_g1_i4.p2 TRINITY_DN1074_c2_g1~~TRINITY_DN1074_c2_g1_i4.p2  ORF type:complete len:888 (-),score=109.60 TRINITY_DN1074_c2_g1_i4:755-3418(-)